MGGMLVGRDQTFSDNLLKFALYFAFLKKLGKFSRIFTKTMDLFLEFNRERDDITRHTTMLNNPFCNKWEVFALLAEVVLHGEINEINRWFGCD